MSYADSLLASGERIVRIAHQHWFVLVWRARWAILALIIAALLTFSGHQLERQRPAVDSPRLA